MDKLSHLSAHTIQGMLNQLQAETLLIIQCVIIGTIYMMKVKMR
jgi:hypothetical protein